VPPYQRLEGSLVVVRPKALQQLPIRQCFVAQEPRPAQVMKNAIQLACRHVAYSLARHCLSRLQRSGRNRLCAPIFFQKLWPGHLITPATKRSFSE
jgi:hypothetical protein